MKNVLLVDFNASEDWQFYYALNKSDNGNWELLRCVSNQHHGNNLCELIRYIKYFIIPFKIFIKRKRYDQVLAWQQFYGLILAFYCALFRVKKAPAITVMTFIYKPKKIPVIGWVYDKFIRYIVKSGYVTKYIVFSENECSYYSNLLGIRRENIIAIKLGIEDVRACYDCNPFSKYYFLSAGRSNRDYNFLFEVWQTIENYNGKYYIEVISEKLHNHTTENITVLNNCHGKAYMRKLGKCYAVILPLDDENISSGQLVVLQAMMMGKPVIATKNNSITDYIINGYNGYVIEKNKESLLEAIENIEKEEHYQRLSKNAREYFEKEFSLYSMGLQVGKIIG